MTALDTPTATGPEREPHAERSAWLAMTVIMGATIMVALDTTIVNVALHEIGVDLGVSDGVEWVVSGYLLAVCLSQPATGWLADRFGRRKVFLSSLVAFTVASIACGASPGFAPLVVFRVLQGLGGGALMPVGMAMVLDLFPRERHGRAIGIWGMSAMLAPAVGPTLGGWLVTSVSWHWLFLINAPIGVITLVAGLRLLPDVGHRERRPFDATGLLLGSGGLSLFVLGLSEANSWGWGSVSSVGCIGGGVALLGAFVVHELRTDHPLIELRMFEGRSFRLAMGAMLFVYIAHFGRLVFIPLELESLRGETALTVGLLFLPAAIVSAIGMTLGGRLVDQVGPRVPILFGCGAMVVAMGAFTRLTLTTPLPVIGIVLCVQGLGMGTLTAPAMIAGLSELPANLTSQGTALRSLLGQVSGALAVAILGAVVAARSGMDPTPVREQAAYGTAFGVAALGVCCSFLLAWRLPRGRPTLPADVEAEALLAVE